MPGGSIKKNLVWYGAGVATLFGLGLYYGFYHSRPLSVAYREVVAELGDIDVRVTATGVVQPENRVEIKLPLAGRVERVLVKEGQLVKKGQVLAWMSSTERAALLDAARAQGQDEVKKWEELFSATAILAPISGTVIKRNVEAGQTLTPTESVMALSDRLTVKALVDETDIGQIVLKQKADIILDAYPNQVFSAVVDQIAFDSKTVNNVTTYTVDVLPDSPPDFLRSGMTANVTFMIAAKKGVLVVPNEALRVIKGQFVLLIKSEPQNQEVPVEIGATDGRKTEIIKGLKAGVIVLVSEVRAGGSSNASGGANPFLPFTRKSGGGR